MSNKKQATGNLVKTIIGLALMLGFSLLPLNIPYITDLGMKVIGIFLGTIFMWSTGSMIWPSILGVVLLGWFGYKPMGEVLKDWMGNPVAVMIFFLLILVGCFSYYKCTAYVARFFLTNKIVIGRPWLFTLFILLGVYLMATFVNPWAGVFLFLPVVQNLCVEVGYEKTDRYTKLMTILVVMAALLGFPSAYFNGTILGLNGVYAGLAGAPVDGGKYMAVTVPIAILCLVAIVLTMRFLIRPDVSKLKTLTLEQLNKNPLPPMNRTQKIVSSAIVIYILAMLIPVIVPGNPVSDILSRNINGIAMTLVAILCLLTVDNKPILPLGEIISKHFSWPTYLMIASSLSIGGALTSKDVGFRALLDSLLTPIFAEMNYTVFLIAVVVLGVVISNVMNSAVLMLILHPIIFTYAQVIGSDGWAIITLVTFCVIGFAAITPSASPYAATIFGQTEVLEAKNVYKYASLFVLIETLIALAVGIPLINLVF